MCSLLAVVVLEERAVYYRETKNGLYSTLPFVLSNTLVNIPFLLFCTVLFTLICYWAIVRSFPFDQRRNLKLVDTTGSPSGCRGFFPFCRIFVLVNSRCGEPSPHRRIAIAHLRGSPRD